MRPWLKVSSERLEKPGIEIMTPGLQGEKPHHYTMEASKSNTNRTKSNTNRTI